MTEKAGLYARVSLEHNQQDNSSLDTQLESAQEYALAQGWEIVAEVREKMSGDFVLARPEFNKLLEMANSGQLARIVVDIPDRLGRGDAVAKLELLAEMSGCKIVYAKEQFDTSTIEGYVQKTTDQLVSGIERIKIGQRTARGKRAYARQGRVIATKRRPYGYHYVSEYDERGRKISCTLEIVEDEAEIVREIFQLYAFEGYSPNRIGRLLTERGVLTMNQKEGKPPKHGLKHQWSRTTLLGILKNETYTGVWYYGKNKVKRHDGAKITTTVTLRKKNDPYLIAVPVPAILEPGIFEAAQRRMIQNRKRNFKPTRNRYLLRHMIKCIHDSTYMFGYTSGNTGYYRCRRSFSDYYDENKCGAKWLNQSKGEDAVWNFICEQLLNAPNLADQLRRQRNEAEKEYKALVANIAVLETQDLEDQRRLDKYLELCVDGTITKSTYLGKKKKHEQAIQDRELQRSELQARLSEVGILSAEEELELERFRQMLLENLEIADFESKRRVLEMLSIQCIWDDENEELTVTGVFNTMLNLKY